MDLTTLSFADLYAVKCHAKEKEGYYRVVKYHDPGVEDRLKAWENLLTQCEKEISNRLTSLLMF